MKLALENISKNYGEKKALDRISFLVEPGVYGILGPNGAGKSTLMNILTGNLRASSGRVLVDGRAVERMGRGYYEKIGYMPQQQALYPSFRVYHFLLYMAALKGIPGKDARRQIPELLDRVGLGDVRNQRISALSGGMKQRILLVQAVLGNPQLLVLDEPTAGLDPRQRIEIRNLIAGLALERIVLIATHIVSDVEYIAKEFLLLKKGRLEAKNSREGLIDSLEESVYEIRIPEETLPEISGKYQIANIARDGDFLRVRILSGENLEKYGARRCRPVMEDVYLSYFGE